MSANMRVLLAVTDIAFLVYWAVAGAQAAGLLALPADWLYPYADDLRVVAWNWSFFPLDLAFSLTGLAAIRAARRGQDWKPLALTSLVLTMVAGGMAVGYWTLLGEISWSWYLANLVLLLWPIPFLPRLMCGEMQR